MLGNERLQLRDDLAVPVAGEIDLDPLLEDAQAQLLESLGLAPKSLRAEAS
jgi:hypothetical protein